MTKQIAFLSQGPFLCELDDMEYVKIADGRIDMGWTHPPDDVRRLLSNPRYLEQEALIISSSPNMAPDLDDPVERARFTAESNREVLEDAADMFHGHVGRNDRLIPIATESQ